MPLVTMKTETDKVKRLLDKLGRLTPAVLAALDKAALREMRAAMDEAQQLVPVQYGRLRSSAYIRSRDARGGVHYELGYEAPYAIYVHEIPNKPRQLAKVNAARRAMKQPAITQLYTGRTTRGTPGAERNGAGYKWLARAINKTWRGAAGRIARALRPVIQRMR